ncbi:1-acyl-sn-glycerol-3-phosphate acyltransferase [candidate division KSB3 bacterium]|uniref:1-acyl-sn-glycerol-3-phosphate acyltransferase n=1 Tax=candidate division KSB3 bacterium TaxID=2044937 RepID=A0A2G6E7H7_9BACT|nr:MAG: 1-acyl-sn-glycerol-3-phosphate acyltransferase [candidate division KSB3 bacterium]PIE30368.1 MAG: 1-acyl-sn-glycerol-3-phosphate acyltransferase [candidate division KSB3 bacterium]
MNTLVHSGGQYRSPDLQPSLFSRTFPSSIFYIKFLHCVWNSARLARKNLYDGDAWVQSSLAVFQALEEAGVRFDIRGIDFLREEEGPCVFIGNHMSMLETMILPGLIQPLKDVTFVIKQTLLEYPIFKHIMRARMPIAVRRQNPRHDLKVVLEEGMKRLHAGMSIIIFPQTTRTTHFDPAKFNSIGVKLSQKADVPVIPVALLTDAWQNGRYLKDFGRIVPEKPVLISFGQSLRAKNCNKECHVHVVNFIQKTLREEQL